MSMKTQGNAFLECTSQWCGFSVITMQEPDQWFWMIRTDGTGEMPSVIRLPNGQIFDITERSPIAEMSRGEVETRLREEVIEPEALYAETRARLAEVRANLGWVDAEVKSDHDLLPYDPFKEYRVHYAGSWFPIIYDAGFFVDFQDGEYGNISTLADQGCKFQVRDVPA